MCLAPNHKLHEKDASVALNTKPKELVTAELEDSIDSFPTLVLGGMSAKALFSTWMGCSVSLLWIVLVALFCCQNQL
jgi:hypothetical protein